MSDTLYSNTLIQYIAVDQLKHIEGYSQKRVDWLVEKIRIEQVWTKPLCVDSEHFLVMDGQHRMESAKILGLNYVPCVLFDYKAVTLWSLRENYTVDHDSVIARSLRDDVYPYKTVKHHFPIEIPKIAIKLDDLIRFGSDAIVERGTECV